MYICIPPILCLKWPNLTRNVYISCYIFCYNDVGLWVRTSSEIGPFYVNCARKELKRIDNNSIFMKLFFLSLKDALEAMKALGLNPAEQEMIDMTNEVSVNGLIYYPDFCKLVLRKYREENRETLNQALFKVMVEIIRVTFLCQNLLI